MMKTFTQVLLLIALCFVGTSAQAQYCMIPGRTSYSANQPGITNFKLNTIDRTSGNVENALSDPPIVVTGESTTLERGETYTVTLSHSRDAAFFPNARNNIRIWIDYDGNKDFTDAGETVVSKDFEQPGTTYTTTFTVPMTAPLGTTRMRVTAKMSSDAGHTIPTPCDMPADPIDYHGEMEDYDVTIVDAPTSVSGVNTNVVAAIYPNPTSSHITIALNVSPKSNVTIDLYDVTGKLISNISDDKAQTTYQFDLNNYVSVTGVYFIKVAVDGSYSYQKVVKTN